MNRLPESGIGSTLPPYSGTRAFPLRSEAPVAPAGVHSRGESELRCLGGYHAVLGGALFALAVSACTPTVQMAAPKEPITINLNVKLDAEVRVKIEEQADRDITENPDIF